MIQRLKNADAYIARLKAAADAAGRPLNFMEVCGTHTVSAFRSGLHSLMPASVSLLSGPGCPVCVTSQGDIDQMIDLGRRDGITVCTYGDMLRVTGSRGSLEAARGAGADVRVIYSALDAVRMAAAAPDRQFVLAAVGFETTTPATAAAVLEASRLGLNNFTVYASHKRIMPAMTALLDTGNVRVDGFLCPGHVSVIIGCRPFGKIVRRYHLPCVVVGFEDWQIAEGLAVLAESVQSGRPVLQNLYPEAVTPAGNRFATNLVRSVFKPTSARWRGLGVLPHSGLALRRQFRQFDAAKRFRLTLLNTPEPAGCRCGDVITARAKPSQCPLFATACTPVHPIGPCMVSSEGTCAAWFKYGRLRDAAQQPSAEIRP